MSHCKLGRIQEQASLTGARFPSRQIREARQTNGRPDRQNRRSASQVIAIAIEVSDPHFAAGLVASSTTADRADLAARCARPHSWTPPRP